MLDNSLIFDGTIQIGSTPAVAGVAITTTRVSTNVLDLGVSRDLGAGNILGLHCDITTALTGGTSLQVEFQGSALVGSGYVGFMLTEVIPAAQLIQGAPLFRFAYPLNQMLNATAGVLAAPPRFIRLNYIVVGTFTAGAVVSYLNPINDRQQYYSYPNNYSVQQGTGL